MPLMNTWNKRHTSQRGSVLLVALIFGGIIAIALTSYLQLTRTAVQVSQRSFLANDAMNIAEAGLEQTLWSFNQANVSNAAAWTDWTTVNTNHKRRTFTDFTLTQNATAAVKVFLKHYDSTGFPTPIAIARSTVTPARGEPVIKMVEVHLSRRSFFSTGLVGKRGVRFNGNNPTVDSWVSGVDVNPITPTAYSAFVRRTFGSIAALSVEADVSVGNANIFGYVSVGSADIGGHVTVGSNGIVSGDFSAASGTVDTDRISGNFTADLPDVGVPTPATFTTVSGTGIIEGETYPKAAGNGTILDPINAADLTYYYKAQAVDLDATHGKSPGLTIRTGCKVVFILMNGNGGSGTELVGTGVNSQLTIQTGATLAVYAAGNVRLAGLGVANQNGTTTAFQVWGTNTTLGGQSINISGNGGLTGIIYAPNATIHITGNGDIKGSVVGDTITVNGNGNFHYDESLGNFGGSNPFRVAKWRELVSETQRNVYASEMAF